ncbi:hypothetical protein MLD38_033729 [Melastoma candidum]|uniref:Uncharacterized protein n=1 Tax=Melastoma candidum TaxID=119954 RepID=A0ACB9M9Z5_9MYRT|nr:hypothetical protein MLD38_033729 [Melastoma candidum]
MTANVNWDELGFGLNPAEYMFIAKSSADGDFSGGKVTPYRPISLDPAAGILNYGQGVLEGVKAYRTEDSRILLFRPEENASRMRLGAERLCMPAPSVEQFLDAAKQTVTANRHWVPPPGKGSLYIRPLLVGTGPGLAQQPATEVTFMVYANPVGNFHEVYKPTTEAKAAGFSDVLFLDAATGKYIEEASCNVFIIKENVISTPPTDDVILPGITRRSIMDIARWLGIQVEERPITVEEVTSADEVFCTGTAVGVSPVGGITYQEKRSEYITGEDTVTIPASQQLSRDIDWNSAGQRTVEFRARVNERTYGNERDCFASSVTFLLRRCNCRGNRTARNASSDFWAVPGCAAPAGQKLVVSFSFCSFWFFSSEMKNIIAKTGALLFWICIEQLRESTVGYLGSCLPATILKGVRHGQGIHNVEGDKIADALLNPQYLDTHLTKLGWWQVDNLRKHVQTSGLSKKIDLVITSPLMRTLQTAVGVFGGEGSLHEPDIPPLMMENAGKSGRAAISSLNCPPILAVELCREHLGVRPCDKRSSISNYRTLFPGVDFSMVECDEDILWNADIREANEELAERGRQFLNWLWTRREKEIAVVTHSGFLFHIMSSFGNDCHPSIKTEICKHFANCELRSVVIVDRSMHGSDPTTTNYPGKIPAGLDFPSSNVNNHSMGKNNCNST